MVRRIGEVQGETKKIVIWYNPDYREYSVGAFGGDKYYTNDYDDAVMTAGHMAGVEHGFEHFKTQKQLCEERIARGEV